MKQLSKALLEGKPEAALLELPERILQFGTGVLLRGLPDYLIDKANRQGKFNGRVVAVKSTTSGDIQAFERQDNLYTLCVRGVHNGHPISENLVLSTISRVLSAERQWEEVLACAANPMLSAIISNTTEVGICLIREDIRLTPPASFPGKLLAFLHARYRIFNGDDSKGLVIVPTELVPNNGYFLQSTVLELAHWNKLEPGFMEWLKQACIFCNSLVDRIVPGKPGAEQLPGLEQELGYRDDLLTIAEPYAFWAIEGGEKVSAALSFQQANTENMVIEPDIERYRERKLRLLNGTHTLCCGLAHLAGFDTVYAAMANRSMRLFIENLMLGEIAPAIPRNLPQADAIQFGRQVLDRFYNPYVAHRWLSIAVQYSAKMRMRNIPVLLEHYRRNSTVPGHFALGFAAFLCFYRQPGHAVTDDNAAYFIEKWQTLTPAGLTGIILADAALWGADLSLLPGFAAQVYKFVSDIVENGALKVLNEFITTHEAKSSTNTPA